MPTARCFCAAASMGNLIYVFGGHNGGPAFATVECFDPVAGVWQYAPPMPTPRFDCAATSAAGKIYVFGGASSHHSRPVRPRQTLATAERFDPESRTWEELPSMTTARRHLAAVAISF